MIPQFFSASTDYPLSASLARLTAAFSGKTRITTQDWLQSLDGKQLAHVESGTHEITNPAQPKVLTLKEKQDLSGVAVVLVGLEAGAKTSPAFAIKHIDVFLTRLMLSACAERLRRLGWVRVHESFRITSAAAPQVSFTEAGLIGAARSADPNITALVALVAGGPLQ